MRTSTLTVTGDGSVSDHTGLVFPGAPVGAQIVVTGGRGLPSASGSSRRVLTMHDTADLATKTDAVQEYSTVDGTPKGAGGVLPSLVRGGYPMSQTGVLLVAATMTASASAANPKIIKRSIAVRMNGSVVLRLVAESSGHQRLSRMTISAFECIGGTGSDAGFVPFPPGKNVAIDVISEDIWGPSKSHGTITDLKVRVVDF
jgi:hypothetical protein